MSRMICEPCACQNAFAAIVNRATCRNEIVDYRGDFIHDFARAQHIEAGQSGFVYVRECGTVFGLHYYSHDEFRAEYGLDYRAAYRIFHGEDGKWSAWAEGVE